VTAEGGYIVSGWTGAERHHDSVDLLLLQTDADGQFLWNRVYKKPLWQGGHEIRQMGDGGFMVAAICRTPEGGILNGYLVKTDPRGNIVWDRICGGARWDEWHGLHVTSNGNFIFCGGTRSIPRAGRMLSWIMETNSSGDTLWKRTYVGGFGYLWSIVQTRDGGYVAAGRAGESRSRDLGVLKLDDLGEPQWKFVAGGEKSDRARLILQSSDGNYVVAGYTASQGAGGQDFWLIKISEPN